MDRRLLILSEAVLVVAVWACAILLPSRLVIQVQQTLSEIWRDSSATLQFIASTMGILLEIYVRRMFEDLFLGMGFLAGSARLWSDVIQHAWAVYSARFCDRSPGMHVRWLRRQVTILSLERMINPAPAQRTRLSPPDPKLPRYKYKRLSAARAIRLISLKPQTDGKAAPIACSMVEVLLDSAPSFIALSYAWDSEDGTQQIVCNDARLTVTKNCAAALRRIREDPTCKGKQVWVDAICINQAATREKHRQLGIMGDIYRMAASVRVWLGEEDKSSRLVCDYFAKISGVAEERGFHAYDSVKRPKRVGLDMARQWPLLSKSLADFFSRSWFTRAWPVQEVTLPRPGHVTVVCGDACLRFEYIRFGWNLLRELGVLPSSANLDQAVALQFYLADAIAMKRGLVIGSEPRREKVGNLDLDLGKPLLADLSHFSFTKVINAMRFKACRDPKDRFFSLYGVFEELDIDHGIPLSVWTQTDAQVFSAVALACFKLDGTLDALRLAQLPDPYLRLSDNLLLSARRNPYDGLSTSMFAMTGRIFSVATNLAAGRDACYHAPTAIWRADLPSWVPDWTHLIPTHIDAARHISLIDTPAPTPLLPSPNAADEAVWHQMDHDGTCVRVEAKVVGRVADLGTVDFPAYLFWQLLAGTLSPSQRDSSSKTLDPVVSAVCETAINLVWRTHMAQVLVSMRMAVRTMGLFDIWAIGTAAYTSGYFRSRAFEFLCTRFPSVASCPTDGPGMRARLEGRLRKVEFLTESHAISQAISVFYRGRTYMNSDMWHQSAADISFIVGGLLWEFRVSLIESLFRTKYDDVEWTVALPVLGLLISAAMQTVAVLIGDTAVFLLAWSVGVAAKLGFVIAFVVWTWKIYALQVLLVLIVVPRAVRDPVRFFRSLLFGATSFRQPGANTQGTHFFVTDTGVTASTSGPVARRDCLALVRGSNGYLVLRPSGEDDCYLVVGASHVGAQPPVDKQLAEESWARIQIR